MSISSCGVLCGGGGIVYVVIGDDDGDDYANNKLEVAVAGVYNKEKVAHSVP
jgi:hypothetical protein